VPTPRGWLLLCLVALLLTMGISVGVEEFVLLGVAIGVVWLVALSRAAWSGHRSRRALRVRTVVERGDLLVGDLATGRLVLTNSGPNQIGPLLVEAPDHRWLLSRPGIGAGAGPRAGVPGREGTAPPPWRTGVEPVVVPPITPGASWSMDVPVPTDQRGLRVLRPVQVWVSDPFGLAARRVGAGSTVHVVVCPTPAPVPVPAYAPTEVGQRNAAPIEGPARTWRPAGDELADLRDYQPGDRLARLHWPVMARTGELVVRDFVEPLGARVPMLIDLRPDEHDPDGPERAIGASARVGADILASGFDLEVRTTSGERAVVATAGDGVARLLRLLALLQIEDGLGDGNPQGGAAENRGVVLVSHRGAS
jgi:uncharacterized protein (DUF58 family)